MNLYHNHSSFPVPVLLSIPGALLLAYLFRLLGAVLASIGSIGGAL